MRTPPMVPAFLLERLLPESEPILGDLTEELKSGRTRRWFWKQAFGALLIGLRDEILSHKLLAIRAVATGWAVLLLSSLLFWNMSLELVGGLMPMEWHVFLWTHPPGIQVLLAALGGVVYLGSGWAVARFHRPHQVATLVVYALSLTVWRFPGFGDLVVAHHRPHYLYSLTISLLVLFANVGCISLGGLLAGAGRQGRGPAARENPYSTPGGGGTTPGLGHRSSDAILPFQEETC